ncbi:MAG: SDR family oxidoreductase [bacterium]
MGRLENKTAVITGGAGGIGLAAGRLFAEEGAGVLLVDVNGNSLKKAVETIKNGSVDYCVADVAQADQVKNYVDRAVECFGAIDIFINNAGIEGEVKSIPDYSIEIFDKVTAVNIRGVWLGLKYVIPVMKQQGKGSIILTSSVVGIKGRAMVSAYTASKHAGIGLMRCAALECAGSGIRVNAVSPAPTETRMMRSLEEKSAPADPEGNKQARAKQIPLGRYGKPEEVANLMLFLAGDESRFCTGGVYTVDGGISAT